MLHSFNRFINESKEDEFRSLKKGDIVLYIGAKYQVKSADGYLATLVPLKKAEGEPSRTVKANLAQYKERSGGIVEKFREKEDED